MSNNPDDENNPIVVDPDTSNSPYYSDWMTVATVLDRLFLICFLVVLILGTLAILA